MRMIFESKQLNEGPGAGYTVSGTLTKVVVHKILNVEKVGGTDLAEYKIDIEADAEFVDVEANSYYYGGKIDSTPVHISSITLETTEGDVSTSDVKWALDNAKIEANLGGGRSHSTFDGVIDVDYNGIENSSELLAVTMEMLDTDAIEYLDRAVQDGYTDTLYAAVIDGVQEDAFDTEEEAIEYAKKYDCDEVVIIYQTMMFNGDIDVETGGTVWTNDGAVEESFEKPLVENVSDEERIPALANYLNIPEDEIEHLWDYEYQTSEGDYLVVTEDEARELAEDDIRNLFDELGLESFTQGFRDWIIMNALETDWFEYAVRESYESYVDGIKYEEGRFEEEILDAGIISEEDVENGYDEDEAAEKYVDYLVENAGDPVDYCGDNFGWDWVTQMANDHGLIDMDVVVEECIDQDGIAHFIARYDGDEHDLGNGLYAYRTN